jgi:uncharacterized DUF497 family protein
MCIRASESVGTNVYIAEWEWDDANVEHMAEHRVSPAHIESIWSDEPKFRRNKRSRAASHAMIGPDAGGRMVVAFIRQVELVKGRWRVITAREATAAERRWWELS